MLMPLTFVVALSMIKDGFEDFQRAKSDKEENNRVSDCLPILDKNEQGDILTDGRKESTGVLESLGPTANPGEFHAERWCDIKVGQIIKVHENEYFPCDMLLLSSSLPKGICYIETKNLDGETNLKHK